MTTNPLMQSNALAPIAAFEMGRGMRTNRLMGEAMAGGDYEGAAQAAFRGGNLEGGMNIRQAIAQMDQSQREAAGQRAQTLAQFAGALSNMPYEQRRGVLQNPMTQQQLSAVGIDPAMIAQFDPTDQNIMAAAAPAQEVLQAMQQSQARGAFREQLSPEQQRLFDVNPDQFTQAQNRERDTSLLRELAAAGVDPNSPEGRRAILQGRSPQVNVNIPGQPQIGSIPPGYEAVRDPATGNFRMQPIPGGPAERDIADEERRLAGAQQQRATQGMTVIEDVNLALDLIASGLQTGPMTAGLVGPQEERGVSGIVQGMVRSSMPEAAQLQRYLSSIASNVGFDQLQIMRQNSATGGALGNVTELQLRQLQSVLGSITLDATPEELHRNLVRLQNLYLDIVHGTPEQIQELIDSGQISAEVGRDMMVRNVRPFDNRPNDRRRGGATQADMDRSFQVQGYAEGTILEGPDGTRYVIRNGVAEPQ